MAYNMDRWRELLPDGWRPSWLPQMPFTDYHQLNLDWIIETVKEWSERLIAFFDEDGAKDLVEDVLEEHPEWVTTVMDGSITRPKINVAFLPEIENAYVTPEMFGAVGDGVTDDTNAVTQALEYSETNLVPVGIINKYRISTPIATNTTIFINMVGRFPYRVSQRNTSDKPTNGFFVLDEGVDFFDGCTVSGSCVHVGFLTTAASEQAAYTTGSIFNNCEVSGFTMAGCTVSRIGSVFTNTNVKQNSMFKDCIFLNIDRFNKNTVSKTFIDSVIEGCYINGGRKTSGDHDCFNWWSWNGSVVRNNFIDYYRCIFNPVHVESVSAYLPTCHGNIYEVFLYLYKLIEPGAYMTANFENETINWTDTASTRTPELASYTKFTYTGHDNNIYEVPENAIWISSRLSMIFKNIRTLDHIGNLVFIQSVPASYPTQQHTTEISGEYSILDDKVKTAGGGIYNGGSYHQSPVNLPFYTAVETLPDVSTNWNTNGTYHGRKVLYNGKPYRAVWSYQAGALEWKEYN